jgi:hypothetical protein
MEQILQLKHPSGKKAARMNKGKYDLLRKVLLNCLKTKGESSHADILQAIIKDFKKNKTKFEGSVEWHMEWVKLDQEARKIIKRIGGESPVKFALVKQKS